MIREAQRSELPRSSNLWLESTIWGHPFIKSSYSRDCIPLVRDAYLANAQNWVWEKRRQLLGFVSIMEGRFLATMLVAPKAVKRGIGKARDAVCAAAPSPDLMLEVYQKNQPAIHFYHAQGFHIVDCAWQDETQLPTWIMSWPVVQTL
ncbi:N-acetyltransferase [Shigella sonnei]